MCYNGRNRQKEANGANGRELIKTISSVQNVLLKLDKREGGIPSNRGSRYGESVNKLVHTARTLQE